MLPRDLKSGQFAGYPPEARKLVTNYLGTLQQLPLGFLPSLLRELIDYDFKFPAERKAREKELANLGSLSAEQLRVLFQGFAQIHLSPELEAFDWAKSPIQFVERLSAYLWSTHQLDAFRKASMDYADHLRSAAPPDPPPIPRLGITVVGQGVTSYDEPLFRKLRPHGAYFSGVKPEDGLQRLLEAVAGRAKSHPAPYGHWYIDGGEEADHAPTITCVSYKALEPARAALLRRMQPEIDRPGMGPEALRTLLAQLRPADLGMDRGSDDKTKDEVLARFEVSLLTEGSGTQIFSTSFAQWAARETLRRAQPLTLLVRFAPRQRQKPMNELLSAVAARPELDFVGSLIDADFGAYYNWLNQQRLPGAEQSSFLVWFEGHSQALAIGPSMPRGTESTSVADLEQLLAWAV
ncbi:MAG: hypothetical protein WAN60_02500 [Candidatus Sulfotelmatobacter sp.]